MNIEFKNASPEDFFITGMNQIKMQKFFVSIVNKIPGLKKVFLGLMNFYYKFFPFILGNVIRIPEYVRNLYNSKVIVKPNGIGNFGSIFNPGVLLLDDCIFLLANAQKIPWFKARGEKRKYYMKGNPHLILLNIKNLKIKYQNTITKTIGIPKDKDYAIEDFRLFHWRGKKMINHSLVVKGNIDGFTNQVSVLSAISFLDEKDKSFRFFALPKPDFPLQNFEKNWMYKENGKQLLLFYSLNPYKVLILDDEKNFSFKTIINQHLSSKIHDPGGFGTMVSLSTNPIDFDDKHWLIIIHQIKFNFIGRCYYHWAVLIDRITFLPTKITSKPIFSGMGARGRLPGIRYISSVLKLEDEILFFAGEGDICVTLTKKKITELQRLFVVI